jgi:transcriptional regulator with XRE-family HTH domain
VRETQRDITQATAQQAPPDPLASAVARSVSDLRHTAGLSERAAARKLGTSQTQLRRMEDPRYLPSLRSLARLATVYGYELKVDFAQKGVSAKSVPPQKAVAKDRARAKTAAGAKRRTTGSASPSKARAGAPRRGRAAARAKTRRAAPRRRS